MLGPMPEDLMPKELREIDTFELVRLGKSSITVGGIVAAIVIVLALLAARIISGGLRGVRRRSGEAGPSIYIFEKLTTYGLVILGLIAAFSTLGLDLSSLTLFAGALGVGLGFGMQGVVKLLGSDVYEVQRIESRHGEALPVVPPR